MAIAKVQYKENASATPEVWMDTTQKTVTAGTMLSGTTALKNDGTGITGNIASKSSSDLTASGATVTAPAGYYPNAASKTVASGTAGTPTASKGTVSNHSVSVTPSVTNTTGYITGGTKNGTAVTVSASELVGGTKSITENGTGIDVTNYAAVDVAVSGGGSSITVEPLSVSNNGTYTAPSGTAYSPVTVNVSGGGTTPASPKDVNFIDYDGTILYSYTKSEFAKLDALPSNPDHSGDEIPLTSQGWNWTLAQINAQLTAQPNDPVTVGQMYVTTDGKTYIEIELHDGRLSPYLGIAVNGTVVVDWGDNSATSTVTGTSLTKQIVTLHEYAAAGRYKISISVSSGSFAFYGTATYSLLNKNSSTATQNRVYSNAVQSVRIGNNTSINGSAFNSCYSLASITIPSGITSISSSAFNSCYSLASITIPSGITSISSSAFSSCYSLASITIPSGITSIGSSAFYYCHSLVSITIPSGITSISGSTFNSCYSLASITIPSGITSIGSSTFSNCYGLAKLCFLPTTPPTAANSNAFTNIPTDCVISVPTGSLSAYTSATNYPSSSTYTYIEE